MFDTHCHLDCLDFEIPIVLLEASVNYGLQACVSIGLRHDSFEKMYNLTKGLSNIWYTVGNHPSEEFVTEPEIESIRHYATLKDVVAIGETGLDYYYDNIPKDVQKKRFERQIDLALSVDKPLVIHCRDAFEEVLQMLKYHQVKFVMHCFTGNAAQAEMCLEHGAMLSYSGILTFKNALANQQAAKITPLESMLIETDSPYLTPVPHRGKPNHPGMVKYVAEKLADIKGIKESEIISATTKNACEFFKVKLSDKPFT